MKPKRFGVLSFLYPIKRSYTNYYGTSERVTFFKDEKEVFSFFKAALEQDVATQTSDLDNRWASGVHETLTTVLKLSSQKIPFRELLKHNFAFIYHLHQSSASKPLTFREQYRLSILSCNPKNYNIYRIVEEELCGHTFRKVKKMTWYQFYQECVAQGFTQEELTYGF